MAGPLISAGFDPASLGAIANLTQFSRFLDPEMSSALDEVGKLLVQSAVANTWEVFANPTGKLADAISYALNGPMEVIITVDVPYAWRMEEGFHGADSLGRIYDEEGKPYAMPALVANEDQITQIMSNAAADAIAAMGVRA